MPRKAFLKKKSLLDRFKDDYATHTGYIQSARAKHTWNNPLTRRKRTKELNKWIKSFAGKNHIHKLARFNAINAGKNEDYADGVKCLRYGSSFELPDGKIITALDKAIRCRRSGAFIVYITGWVENDESDPCNAKYTVYFDTGKYEDYFLTNDIQDLPNYQTNGPIPSDNKVIKDYAMHENTNEAMSLKGFLENLTEKLTKQFDLDLEEVQAYLNSHTQEMQELLDDKELSLKEKVLFVRSEITGEQDEKKSEKLVIHNPCVVYKGDAENAAKAHDYLYKKMPRVKGASISSDVKPLGNNKFCRVLFYGSNTGVMDLFGYYSNLYNDDFWNNCDADPQGWVDPLTINKYDVATPRQESNETDEKLGYEKGHKNSRGENAPWVIRSHEDNRILASFANKKDAEEHLKRMKQYSKKESRNSEDLETYACFIDFATEDDAKKGMEIVKGWHPFRNDTAVLIDSLGEDAANRLWNDWKQKCAKAGLAISDAGEVYKEEPSCFYGNESKKSERLFNKAELERYAKEQGMTNERAIPVAKDLKQKISDGITQCLNAIKKAGAVANPITVASNGERPAISTRDTFAYAPSYVYRESGMERNYVGVMFHVEKGDDYGQLFIGWDKKNNRPFVWAGGATFDSYDAFCNDFKRDFSECFKKSESKNLAGYTSNIISELDGIWACGLNGAKRLAEKYADVIQQNYTDGDLSTAETAKFIAGQENLTESRKKTESKQSEVHLELIDTIIVPKWLWEAHTFGNEYGEDLDEHEQEILAKFEEEYGKQYYLDDRSEEADFRSRNDFDQYGGPCYEVDVYKMS